MSDITQILNRVEQGEPEAADQLLPLVYQELRQLAAHKMRNELAGQTLQPTALVHEAWLRLGADNQPNWKNRGHFFAAAAEAMRRILVERARKRVAMKRGGGLAPVSLDEVEVAIESETDDRILQINDALEKFVLLEPRKALLVKLRYFAGLAFEEAAQALGIAVPTAKEWWSYSRAWLGLEIRRTAAG